MDKLQALTLAFVLAGVAGCAVGQNARAAKGDLAGLEPASLGAATLAERAKPLTISAEQAAPAAAIEPRKIVYTGSFEILVPDVDEALAATKDLARDLRGYMQRMRGSAIIIRVPAERFDEAVAALEKLGTVVSRDITAQDVTEQYDDLHIRLKNAKAMLERLQNLLATAKTAKEALEIEREIGRVTLQIEQLQGRVNSLASRIAYATLSIAFTPVHSAPADVRLRLPFWWLEELGLESLLRFRRQRLY